jgi:uncharacterized protein
MLRNLLLTLVLILPLAAQPRKRVLAWADTLTGYQHDSVSHALAVMERLGHESGAYEMYLRTDSQWITRQAIPEPARHTHNLNDFNAIFYFGTGDNLNAQQKKDLLAFVHDDGKGFVAAHAAATTFFSWPEFGEMLGGRFDEHPWGIINAPIIVEDSKFPGMSNLPLTFPHIDEMYQIKDFSRAKSHVILGLDVSHLPMKDNSLVHHQDADFPLAWAKMYGKGRVYYSALGHDPSTWDDRAIEEMYFQAIRWALKLTDADITPTPAPANLPASAGH